MPLFPAAKMMDGVLGIDIHDVIIPPAPCPVPLPHAYIGPLFLWLTPQFPKMNVFINDMPAVAVGGMGYGMHIPMGAPGPISATNTPYWKRYILNIVMGILLMTLITMANLAIAAIARFIPKRKSAEDFIKDVTGIDSSKSATTWEMVKTNVAALATNPMMWIKFLIPPVPYPGGQGSTAVGSPTVKVNDGLLAFVGPLMGQSCSIFPFVPNAVVLGFSNVLVGVSLGDIARALAVNSAKGAIAYGAGKVADRLAGQSGAG